LYQIIASPLNPLSSQWYLLNHELFLAGEGKLNREGLAPLYASYSLIFPNPTMSHRGQINNNMLFTLKQHQVIIYIRWDF
jgi:hypothetical protein